MAVCNDSFWVWEERTHLCLCDCVPVRRVMKCIWVPCMTVGGAFTRLVIRQPLNFVPRPSSSSHICHGLSKPCLLSVMSFYLLPEVHPLRPQLSSQKLWTLDAMISELCVQRIPVWLQTDTDVWHIFTLDRTTSTSFLRLVPGLKEALLFHPGDLQDIYTSATVR